MEKLTALILISMSLLAMLSIPLAMIADEAIANETALRAVVHQTVNAN